MAVWRLRIQKLFPRYVKTWRLPITNRAAALRAAHQCWWTHRRNVTKCTSSTPCWTSDARTAVFIKKYRVALFLLPRDALQCIARSCNRMSSVRLSVCLSVCPSVTLVDHDHIGWKPWKLTAWTISPTSSLSVAQRSSIYNSQGNIEKFWRD